MEINSDLNALWNLDMNKTDEIKYTQLIEIFETNEKNYYHDENGFLVFTEKYLLSRGFCCENGCRHCPYSKRN